MRWGSTIATLLGLLALTSLPSISSDPTIPHVGGIIAQTNVTGTFRAVAIEPDNDFVAVGTTVMAEEEIVNGEVQVSLTPGTGLVVKYDSEGTFLWKTSEILGHRDVYTDVDVTQNGTLVVSAFTLATNGVDARGYPWVLGFSSSGDKVFEANISNSSHRSADMTSLVVDGNSVIIVGGARVDINGVWTTVPAVVTTTLEGVVTSTWIDTASPDERWLAIAKTGISGEYYASISRANDPIAACVARITTSSLQWEVCRSAESEARGLSRRGDNVTLAGLERISSTEFAMLALRASGSGASQGTSLYDPVLTTRSHAISPVAFEGGDIISGYRDAVETPFFPATPDGVISRIQFASTNAPDLVSVRYDESGDLVWSHFLQIAGTGLYAYGSALDSEPRLIIVGFERTALGNFVPLVVRYEDL